MFPNVEGKKKYSETCKCVSYWLFKHAVCGTS